MISHIKNFMSNRSPIQQVIMRNSIWLSIGEIGSRVARGGLAIVAARMLGASELGVFSYAIALGGFLTFFEDAGIGIFVTREFAKQSEHRHAVFGTALIVKLCLLGAAVLVFLGVGPWITSIPEARILIPVVALVLIFDSLRGFFFSISRAEQRMHIESKTQILTSFLVVAFGIICMLISPTPLALAVGYALGSGIGCLVIFWAMKSYLPNLRKAFSKILFKEILISAWPFTVLAVSNVLIFNTDTLFLGHYGTATEVGYYSAASRLVQMFYIIPSLFAATTFPVLVQKAAGDGIRHAVKKSLLLMAGITIPLVLIMTLGSKLIMPILFGKAFAPASIILSILALSYIPVFAGSVLNNAIFAKNRQRQFVMANIAGVIVNIALDFILIPHYQGLGAAIASVAGLSVITLVTALKLKTSSPLQ